MKFFLVSIGSIQPVVGACINRTSRHCCLQTGHNLIGNQAARMLWKLLDPTRRLAAGVAMCRLNTFTKVVYAPYEAFVG